MSEESGAIITFNVSLRLFVKPGVDPKAIAALINEHFGHGDAIVGSGYEEAIAAKLKDCIVKDIASSSDDAAAVVQSAISEVDLWRDLRPIGDSSSSYDVETLSEKA